MELTEHLSGDWWVIKETFLDTIVREWVLKTAHLRASGNNDRIYW